MLRELKLYDLCGIISPNVIEINNLFNNLFSDLSVYTERGESDLIFMKGEKFIMEQDLKNGYLRCRFTDFWEVLQMKFKLKETEIQEVVSYKIANMLEEALKNGYLIPSCGGYYKIKCVEEAYKMRYLTPVYIIRHTHHHIEEDFKSEYFTQKTLVSQ
jgi:hypothetical protein